MESSLVKIRNAVVHVNGYKVLTAIDWTMQSDQNWAIVGNNGAGKTTFMKLVFGELLPVHGGYVRWFGHPELTPMDQIRPKIGFVSAEYQENYRYNILGWEVVASGLFSSIGIYEKISPTPEKNRFGVDGFLRDRTPGRNRVPQNVLRRGETNPAGTGSCQPPRPLDSGRTLYRSGYSHQRGFSANAGKIIGHPDTDDLCHPPHRRDPALHHPPPVPEKRHDLRSGRKRGHAHRQRIVRSPGLSHHLEEKRGPLLDHRKPPQNPESTPKTGFHPLITPEQTDFIPPCQTPKKCGRIIIQSPIRLS